MAKGKGKNSEIKRPFSAAKDSNKKGVAPAALSDQGLKYRLRFPVAQLFRGKAYNEGDEIEVGEGIFKAYKRRSSLEFEQITIN